MNKYDRCLNTALQYSIEKANDCAYRAFITRFRKDNHNLQYDFISTLIRNVNIDNYFFNIISIDVEVLHMQETLNKSLNILIKLTFRLNEDKCIAKFKDDTTITIPLKNSSEFYKKYSFVKNVEIKQVLYKNPATIVYWSDGSKTVVKCQREDTYDPEKGLAMAILKKIKGNTGRYYEEFKKWLPKEEEKDNVRK